MDENSIQHFGMVVAATLGVVGVVGLMAALVGGWIDSRFGVAPPRVATVLLLLGSAGAGMVAYRPIAGQGVAAALWTDVVERTLWGGAAMAIILVVVAVGTRSIVAWGRMLLAVVFAVVLPAGLLAWVFAHYPAGEGETWVYFLVHHVGPALVAVVILWGLTEPIAARSPGVAGPMVVGFVSAGLACVLLAMPSQQPGLFAGVVGACAGGAVVAGLIAAVLSGRMKISVAGGPVLLWFAVLGALCIYDCVDNDLMPVRSFALLACAPVLAWVVEIGPMRQWKAWKREMVRAGLMAVPVLVVVVPALIQLKKNAAEG